MRNPSAVLRLALLFVTLLGTLAGCGGSGKKSGGASLAEQYEKALKITDAELRASRMVSIAKKHLAKDDSVKADSILENAANAAMSIERTGAKCDILLRIFTLQAEAGNAEYVEDVLKNAARNIDKVEDAGERFPLLIRLSKANATHLKKSASAQQALEKAKGLLKDLPSDQLVSAKFQLTAATHVAGDSATADTMMTAALADVEGLTDARAKSEAQGDAAVAQFEMGADGEPMLTAAKESAKGIEKAESRSHAYASLAKKLILAGKTAAIPGLLKSARDAAHEVGDPAMQRSILDEIDVVQRLSK